MILMFAPWSEFWEYNTLLAAFPALQAAWQSHFARGAVSGIGIVTASAGLFELATAVAARYRERYSDQPDPGANL
ncbi:MAG TPA: hypothetical protein VLD67_10785 [Vicinamibacterales bacterium]|nr:hypothetical protein [Vicinamibacterales bacterium]